MPDFSRERASGYRLICGVDEAGRGPLAGPVVAAAVIFTDEAHADARIHDSKKLTAKTRDALFDHIMAHAHVGVGICSAQEIDAINILQATMQAMARAVEALPHTPELALIDGNRLPKLLCKAEYIIKGDSISTSIAAASIIAKVTRDRMMTELAREYPHYGFEGHAGYGTPAHLEALKTHGPCPAHRRSFAPVRNLLEHAA